MCGRFELRHLASKRGEPLHPSYTMHMVPRPNESLERYGVAFGRRSFCYPWTVVDQWVDTTSNVATRLGTDDKGIIDALSTEDVPRQESDVVVALMKNLL